MKLLFNLFGVMVDTMKVLFNLFGMMSDKGMVVEEPFHTIKFELYQLLAIKVNFLDVLKDILLILGDYRSHWELLEVRRLIHRLTRFGALEFELW